MNPSLRVVKLALILGVIFLWCICTKIMQWCTLEKAPVHGNLSPLRIAVHHLYKLINWAGGPRRKTGGFGGGRHMRGKAMILLNDSQISSTQAPTS